MADNTKRGVFSLDGVTGMLVATVLLLSILAGLTIWGIGVQQQNSSKYYDGSIITNNFTNVKMNSKENANFAFKDANSTGAAQ